MDIRKYFNVTSNETTEDSKLDKFLKMEDESINKNVIVNEKSPDENNIKYSNVKVYEVFTDGSTINNGSKKKDQYGGIGVFFINNDFEDISEPLKGKITNNIAELKACIKAVEIIGKHCNKNDEIHIFTDSEYIINCITKWCKNWEKNGWRNKQKKEILNKLLIQTLYQYSNMFKIKFIHVNSHRPEPIDKNSLEHKVWYGNKMADKLATTASKYSFHT